MAADLPNSVKQLSDSGAFSSLHLQFYASRDPSAPSDVDATLEPQIPTIDLSLLTGAAPQERARMVRQLGRACQDWGFFMVVNHGVPEGLRQAMLEATEQFFDLEEEAKEELRGETVLDPIRYGTSFNTKAEVDVRYWRDFLKLVVHPEFHSPAKPLCFSDVLRDYATCTRRVGMELLKGIWESLELDDNYMNRALKLDSCFQVFAANLYPPCPQPELVVGLPPHSDHGLLTLLHQNGVQGLDVEHGGKWVHVKPLPGSFLVNTGDHMQIVTNGRYKSVLHRAMANGERTRVSVVSLVGPSLDTVVEPVVALVSSERPAMYRGWSYRQFLECQQGNQLKEKSVLELLRL
ncbi:2-oxoglutarate-dependent dioxygenase 19-like [Curcuma longa]|uniref:2-oxoglutarate-dependent dioxygenase 19-like n=1 Tax=Curcuma longa TaxID=136217 RepID=UPI003D9EBCD3